MTPRDSGAHFCCFTRLLAHSTMLTPSKTSMFFTIDAKDSPQISLKILLVPYQFGLSIRP
jgi:hypothetical protein